MWLHLESLFKGSGLTDDDGEILLAELDAISVETESLGSGTLTLTFFVSEINPIVEIINESR